MIDAVDEHPQVVIEELSGFDGTTQRQRVGKWRATLSRDLTPERWLHAIQYARGGSGSLRDRGLADEEGSEHVEWPQHLVHAGREER